jgi:hypothetical protein
VFNYADAMQYYGITDGNNRYKAVYDQVSSYLVDLNPCGFNETCKDGVVPYEDAVNLYFLKVLQMLMLVKLKKSHIPKLRNGKWSLLTFRLVVTQLMVQLKI